MRRTLIRQISVGAVVVAVAAAGASSAFAASSARGHQFGPRAGGMRGFGPFMGGFFVMRGGPGGPGGHGFAFGIGPAGPGGPHGGGAGVLTSDVLSPAASYLGVSLSTLQSDLNGGKTLAQEATAKGKTAAGLIDAIVANEKTVLDSEKAAGWITDAQETNLLAAYKMGITELVNNGPPVPPSGAPAGGPLQTAADYLGMSVTDLQADLKSGKTLAQEATAKGKTVDGLVAAMLAPLKADLDKRVAAGDITAAQETTILNNATTHLTDLVNGTHTTQNALRKALKKTALLHR